MDRPSLEDADTEPLLEGLTELSKSELRERALTALRQRRFDLVDRLLDQGSLGLDALVENLRIYQAELEIQNEELSRSQGHIQEGFARFTSLFNTLPIAELVIDRQGLVKEANLAAQALFGLSSGHFRQHFFSRLVDERDRILVVSAWGNLVEGRSVALTDVRFRARAGRGFIGDLHIATLPVGDSDSLELICAVLDRTEVVRQREALLESDEHLRLSEVKLRERLKELALLQDVLILTTQTKLPVRQVLQHVADSLPSGFRYPRLAKAQIRLPELSASTSGFTESEWMLSLPISLNGKNAGTITLAYRALPTESEDTPFLEEEERLLESVATHLSVYLTRIHDEARLEESRERYRVLAEFSSDWEYWLGTEHRYLYVSPACQRISGYAAEHFVADPDLFARLILPADRPIWEAHLESLRATPDADLEVVEFRIRDRDGAEHWLEHICNPVLTDDGRFLGRRGVNRDITERKRFEEALRRSEDFLNATGRMAKVGGWEYDPAAKSVRWTEETRALLGLSLEGQPGLDELMACFQPEDRAALLTAIDEAISRGAPFDMEVCLLESAPKSRWVQITCGPFRDEDGAMKLLGAIQDVSQIKQSEERLEFLAHHDPLTSLPNRSLFQQRLEKCLQRAKRYKRQVALLFVDLDRFKEVNDTLGHAVGDALLLEVAAALSGQVREVDTIARLGGDEFVVILEDIAAARFAATFADRLLDVFSRPFQVSGHELFVTASIGISIYPDDGQDMDSLVRHADVAMYKTKSSGRNGFSFFEKEMSEGAVERLSLVHDLRLAVQRQELALRYQPQVGLADGHLCGVEALCRWRHPKQGWIPPSVFIPLAEEVGLMDTLGTWVLEQGCRQVIDWDRVGFHVPRLAVNLSVRAIQRPGLAERVASVLETTGLDPARLELEVTETKLMQCSEGATESLQNLRRLGVTLAIDDFGSGYSSLAYLRRLPLSRLKIDTSFTEKLTLDSTDDGITRAIIALARNMGLGVLAEGVETSEQVDFLLAEGCGECQGFLFSEPMTPERIAQRWG